MTLVITMMMMDKLKLESSFEKIINFVNKHLDDRVSGRTKSPEDRSDFLEEMLPIEVKAKQRASTLYRLSRRPSQLVQIPPPSRSP